MDHMHVGISTTQFVQINYKEMVMTNIIITSVLL